MSEIGFGVWAIGGDAGAPEDRRTAERETPPVTKALPPYQVAALIVWIAAAPPELVVNEAIVSLLEEGGWP